MSTISSSIAIQDKFSATLNKLDGGTNRALTGLQKLGQVGGNFGGLNGQIGKTTGLLKSMVGANLIGSGITAGLGVIRNGITGLIGDLSAASATWQTFQGNMENLGLGSGQIKAAKKDMQSYAQQTIYSASEMASTYAQLRAVGTKNTGDLVKGFGGLAAASEDPAQAMKTLSQQATQMAALPAVQWADFKLMLQQSPAGMAAVAKQMNMSTGQMIKQIQAGKIKTQDFFNAINKVGTSPAFMTMATKFKTVGQAVDGLKETLTNKLQSAFDSTSQVGINMVSSLTDKIAKFDLNGLLAKFAAFGNAFKQTMAMPEVNLALGNIKKAIMHVITALTGIKPGQSGLGLMASLGEKAGDGVAKAADAVSSFANWVSSLDPDTIKSAAKGVLALFVALKGYSAISGIFAGIKSELFIGLAAGVAKFIGSWDPDVLMFVGDVLAGIVIAIKGIMLAEKVAGAVQGLVGAFSGMGAAAVPAAAGETAVGTAAGSSAGNMLRFAAAALMIGGAIVLAAAGMWIMVQAATQLASGGWGAVGALTLLVGVIAAVAVAASVFAPQLMLAGAAMLIFGAGLAVVGVAIMLVATGMLILAATMPLIATYGLQAAVAFLALGPALVVFGAGALVGGAAAMVLAAGVMALAVAAMVAGAGAVVLGAGLVIVAAGLALVGAGAVIAGAGLVVLGAGVMAVARSFITAGTMMVTAITGAMTRVKSAVSNGVRSAVAGAKQFGSGLVNVGKDLIKGLIKGVTGMAKSAVKAVSSVVGGIVGKVKGLFKIGSPSRLFQKFGRWTLEGYNNGIRDRAESSINAVANTMSDVAAAADGTTLAAPMLMGLNPGDLLASGFQRAANAVGLISSALGALPANTNLAVAGDYTGSGLVTGDVPASAPSGLTGAGTRPNTTTNSSDTKTINFQKGAIVIDAKDKSASELVAMIEDYLRTQDAGGLS
ncbi:tape measure protein [Lacticaseibacillus hulanensis]|uniref:tape measure protein n=1 Tax=Lacticaseibacillus hulanensis TaxID=2493111 RepID=UPI000FD801CA|nr:tape measure protein [Lacticaseibacillus hulanensis]